MKNFEQENQDYLNIEIPEELDFKVNKALKFGRNKKITKKVYKNIGIVAAIFIAFVGFLNSSESFYKTVENIPVISSISKAMKLNWIKTSYDKGLVVSDIYKKEKDGITFKIVEVLGDSENLRIGYEIESDKELSYVGLREMNLYFNKDNGRLASMSEPYNGGIQYVYIRMDNRSIGNVQLEKELDFEFTFNYLEKGKEFEDITFKGNIELNEEMRQVNNRTAVVNKTIKTNFNEIEILKVETGLTSTKLFTKLDKDSTNFEFINPRILTLDGEELDIDIDIKNDIYEGIKVSYLDSGISEDKVIFKADGIKFEKNFEQRVAIYPKKETIKNNSYGAELGSIEGDTVKVKINDMEGLNLVFDDPFLKLISEEKVSILGISFIDLTLELTNLDQEIVYFGTNFEFKSEPIEIELNFQPVEEE